MTYGKLKEKLEKAYQDVMILAKDPTLGTTRKEQMTGLLFLCITDKVWCNVNDDDEV